MFPVCQAILHRSGEDVVSTCVLVDDLWRPCWAFRAPAFAKKRGGGGGGYLHILFATLQLLRIWPPQNG